MRSTIDWFEPFRRRDTWLLLAGNLLPLLGAFFLGWDASTLVVLYWLETAIVGFWLLIRLAATPKAEMLQVATLAGDPRQELGGIGLALFVLAHAGIFMAVHLFFLTGLIPGEWSRHLNSPLGFITDFVIPSGIWLPLAGLFVMRGLLTVSDLRSGAHPGHVVVGFYARIIVLQLVILISGMAALLVGSVAMLILLVIAKTLAEIFWLVIADHVGAAIAESAAAARKK